MAKPERAVAVATQPPGNPETTTLALAGLLLDAGNPRFGAVPGRMKEQAEILDWIVENFGVDDVLSSLAVNGFFVAEPLVCWRKKQSDNAIVVEGNRRLAACLILTEDRRAARHVARTAEYRAIWLKNGQKTIDPVPVILFEGQERDPVLLSYLGVRHIVSTQPWDSYAKAAWVANVVESSGLKLGDIALMIGDQHRTIRRLLLGYNFINQLIRAGHFSPDDSVRKGRGSITGYPFSWIYTILGYSTARDFVGIEEDNEKKDPVPKSHLKKAALVTRAMFGNAKKGQNSAITDSRQLGDLAAALADKEKVTLLEQGRSLIEVEQLTEQIEDRLARGLVDAKQIQSDLVRGLTESEVKPAVASQFLEPSAQNRRLATEIEKKLKEAANITPE